MASEEVCNQGNFKNSRGLQLYCKYWRPEKPAAPRAVVFIAHGFAEHSGYYNDLANELYKEGFFVFTHDHVGHGHSEGARAIIDSIDEYVDDIVEHFAKIKETESLPEDVPYFIVGHSMGGTISIKLVMKMKDMFRGVILIAPAVIINSSLATPTAVFFTRILSSVLPWFPLTYVDESKISRDLEKVKQIHNDELFYHGRIKVKWGYAMLHALQEIHNNLSNVDCPFFCLHGDKDSITDISGSKLFYEGSSSKDKTLKIYEGAYHNLLQEPEDVRTSVIKETVEWITQRLNKVEVHVETHDADEAVGADSEAVQISVGHELSVKMEALTLNNEGPKASVSSETLVPDTDSNGLEQRVTDGSSSSQSSTSEEQAEDVEDSKPQHQPEGYN